MICLLLDKEVVEEEAAALVVAETEVVAAEVSVVVIGEEEVVEAVEDLNYLTEIKDLSISLVRAQRCSD